MSLPQPSSLLQWAHATVQCMSLHFYSSTEITIALPNSSKLNTILCARRSVMELLSSLFPVRTTEGGSIIFRDERVTVLHLTTQTPIRELPQGVVYVHVTFYALVSEFVDIPAADVCHRLATFWHKFTNDSNNNKNCEQQNESTPGPAQLPPQLPSQLHRYLPDVCMSALPPKRTQRMPQSFLSQVLSPEYYSTEKLPSPPALLEHGRPSAPLDNLDTMLQRIYRPLPVPTSTGEPVDPHRRLTEMSMKRPTASTSSSSSAVMSNMSAFMPSLPQQQASRSTSNIASSSKHSTPEPIVIDLDSESEDQPMSCKTDSSVAKNDDDVILCKIEVLPSARRHFLKSTVKTEAIESSIPREVEKQQSQMKSSPVQIPIPTKPIAPINTSRSGRRPHEQLQQKLTQFSSMHIMVTILDKVLAYLPLYDRLKCRLVCSTWRRLVDTSIGWKHIEIAQSQITDWREATQQLCYFGNCENLVILMNGCSDSSRGYTFENLCSLVHSSAYHLKRLIIRVISPMAHIGVIWLDELVRPLQSLRRLTIISALNCKPIQIKFLSTSPDILVNASLCELNTCGLVSPEFIGTLSMRNFPKLKAAKIFCSTKLFIHRLDRLALTLSGLEELSLNFLSNCDEIKNYLKWLPKLKKLSKLRIFGLRCSSNSMPLFMVLRQMTHLQHLHLETVITCIEDVSVLREISSNLPACLHSLAWLLVGVSRPEVDAEVARMTAQHFRLSGNQSVVISVRRLPDRKA